MFVFPKAVLIGCSELTLVATDVSWHVDMLTWDAAVVPACKSPAAHTGAFQLPALTRTAL